MSLLQKFRVFYRDRGAPALLFLQELEDLWFGDIGEE